MSLTNLFTYQLPLKDQIRLISTYLWKGTLAGAPVTLATEAEKHHLRFQPFCIFIYLELSYFLYFLCR